MMHTTLRFAPKTNIEKAVKRITGAVVALAMVASLPGVNMIALVGQSARAVDPAPIVAQFYDSFDGNGDPVGDNLLDYALCGECYLPLQRMGVATLNILAAGDYEVRTDVYLNSVDEQKNESIYLTFSQGGDEYTPTDPNAGSWFVVEDKEGVKLNVDAYAGTFALPEGAVTLNLYHYATIWDDYEEFFNGGNKHGPESVTVLKVTLTPKQIPVCTMEIEKTGTPEVNPGGTINYTITFKNTGTADCTGGGVELKDFYADDTTFVSATPAPTGGDNLWNFGTVEPGEEHTVQVAVTASSNAQDGDVLTNKTCVWAEQNGPHGDEASWVCDEVTTRVKLPPPSGECRLTVEKSDSPDPVMPGADLDYTVVVTNTGDEACTDTTLTETYDARTTFDSATPAPDTGETVWELGTLAPLEARTIGITVTVGSTLQNGDVLINKACAVADELQSDVCNEEDTTIIKLPPSTAHLVITKKVSDTDEVLVDENEASMGEQMTYTVTVENTGNAGAMDVVLTDDYDESKVTVADADGGTDDGDEIVYPIGVINPGQSVIKEITVKVKSGFETSFSFDNSVQAVAFAHPPVSDEVTTTVTITPPPPPPGCQSNCGGGGSPTAPSISIVKSVNKPVVSPGDIVTYTFIVRTGGTEDSQNVQVTDTLPAGFTFVEGATSARTWNFGAMDEQTSKTENYDVLVGSNVPAGNYENVVVATISNGTAPANRSEARATVEVRMGGGGPSGPTLTIQKIVTTAVVNPGAEVLYNVAVKNIGGVTATNVRVEDVLPAGFTFVEGGEITKTFVVGDLDAGEVRTLVYAVAVAADAAAGFYKNTATARADNASSVSDDAEVEVRVVEVKGFTTLPDTGVGPLNPLEFAFASLMLLGAGALLAYRYRNTLKEIVFERVTINFIGRSQ